MRWVVGGCVVTILAVALVFRVVHLENIPGVNGDEAQYGVRAMRFLRGEAIDWRTPTNNLTNPFFFLPQVALHAVASPSFTLLRLPAVLSGVLALAINYLLCGRAFGRPTAIVSTVVLAVLPINVAYSRFAWDTCQTLPASLLVMYPALLSIYEPQRRMRWLVVAIVGCLAAWLVHPTNVFLAAFLVAVPLVERPERWRWVFVGSTTRRVAIVTALAVVLIAGAGVVRHRLQIASGGAPTPSEMATFARNYTRLFSGVTVYRYIPGSQMPPDDSTAWGIDFQARDAAALVLFGVAIAGCCSRLRRQPAPTDVALLLGAGLGALGFFLLAGPAAIEPHWERYGLCLIAPGSLVLSRGVVWLLERRDDIRRATLVGGLALAALLLADFESNYFRFFRNTAGCSQETFRTGAIEPKRAALEQIVARREGAGEVTIVATSEWWNYWPLAYLALGREDVEVLWWDEAAGDEGFRAALASGDAFVVEYCDSAGSKEVLQFASFANVPLRSETIRGFAERPILLLLGRQFDGAGANGAKTALVRPVLADPSAQPARQEIFQNH